MGRPRGSINTEKRAFSDACREWLEAPNKRRGTSRVFAAVEDMLQPVIEPKYDHKGEPIPGTEYLVNAGSMQRTLEMLVEHAYGRPHQSAPDETIVTHFHEIGYLPGKAKTSEEWSAEAIAEIN